MSDLLRSVNQSAETVPIEPRDRSTLDLALLYAELIDAAAPAGKYERAIAWLSKQRFNDDTAEAHVATIMQALAWHSVASDLGPKLLAALDALRMTPRGRAARGGKDDRPAPNALDQLAQRRAGRGRAAGMDAPAP